MAPRLLFMPTSDSPKADPPKRPRSVALLVDDQATVASTIQEMVGCEEDIEVHHCDDGMRAIAVAHRIKPTVILQDLVMPGTDGFTLVRFFRRNPTTAVVPIIVLSSKEDPRDKSRAFELGASDYLVKIPDRVELVARIRAHSRSFVAHQERDEAYRALERVKSELEAASKELERLAVLDGLTGLPNRRRLDQVLREEWERSLRSGKPLALVLCDVDCFKQYNDTYGHPAGDECLRRISDALWASTRGPADLPARYGGEEFALVLPDATAADALSVGEDLRRVVEGLAIPHESSATAPVVTMSVGVAAVGGDDPRDTSHLVAAADAALYLAKQQGRNRVCGPRQARAHVG